MAKLLTEIRKNRMTEREKRLGETPGAFRRNSFYLSITRFPLSAS